MRKREMRQWLDSQGENIQILVAKLHDATAELDMEHARYTSLYKDYREMEAELKRLQQDQLSAVCSSCKHAIAKTGKNETGYICTIKACGDYEDYAPKEDADGVGNA